MSSSVFRCCLVLTLFGAGCHDTSDSADPFLVPGANNLGIQAEQAIPADGALVAFVHEVDGDLNGDGDAFDTVLEVLTLADGRRTLLPFVYTPSVSAAGGFVSFAVNEVETRADLNGDGDREDMVAHVHRVRDGSTRNLGLALAFGSGPYQLVQSGSLIALGVSERAQTVDLDGDGDLDSDEAFVYEAESGRLTRIDRALAPQPPQVSDGRIVFVSEERSEGDLNGDGDLVDQVAWLYDVGLGRIVELGRSVQRFALDGSTLIVVACECAIDELTPAGSPDLNGNGFGGDEFVEVFDLESGLRRILPASTTGYWGLGGDLALLLGAAPGGGRSLAVYDRFTDALFEFGEVGLVPPLQDFSNRRVAFWIDELGAGRDLDGDGELLDTVLHSFDARSGLLRAAPRPAFSPAQIDGTWAAYLSLPLHSSVRPPERTALVLQDLRSGAILDPGLLARDFVFANGHLALVTPEEWLGTDLNGDQDLLDQVVQVHDLVTGVTTNTGLSLYQSDTPIVFQLDGDVLVFSVSEFDQGVDLDGDQDLEDRVLHAFRLR